MPGNGSDPNRAIEYFEEGGRNFGPDLPNPYMNLGAAYSDMRSVRQSCRIHQEEPLARQPELVMAHVNLGAVYTKEPGNSLNPLNTSKKPSCYNRITPPLTA